MKIFISHALIDHELIKNIKKSLEPHGIKLFVAEHYQDLEHTITVKIENMIRASDVALILLTENGFNSKFVQQEIGYIKSLKKPSLQLIQKGIENKITGFNYGKDYISYDPNKPEIALNKMSSSLLIYWKKKEDKRIQQQLELDKSLAILNERRASEARIGFGLLAGLLILGLTSE